MANSAYVDSASLNTIFKTSEGMVLGLDYSSNLHKLGIDLQALGSGFALYLTVWPRTKETSDGSLSQLSRSGYDFRINTEEIKALINFFIGVPGIGDLYICDGLANYILAAKLASFDSVFYIGHKLCHVKVDNRMVSSYELYANAQELTEALGEDFNCYGDSDLVDISRLRAAYPSLSFWESPQIVGCAALIMSARCAENRYLVNMSEAVEAMYTASAPEQTVAEKNEIITQQESQKTTVVPEVFKEEKAEPEDSEKFRTNRFYIRPSDFKLYRMVAPKAKPDMLAAMLTILFMFLAATVGVVQSGVQSWNSQVSIVTQAESLATQANETEQLADIYTNALDGVDNFSTCVSYCKNNTLGVRVVGWEYYPGYFTVTCSAQSVDIKDSYCEYVNSVFKVKQVNELGLAQGQDRFQLMFEQA